MLFIGTIGIYYDKDDPTKEIWANLKDANSDTYYIINNIDANTRLGETVLCKVAEPYKDRCLVIDLDSIDFIGIDWRKDKNSKIKILNLKDN